MLCAAFVAFVSPRLPLLLYNYDEGLYIEQALLVADGKRPYLDFFSHQPPLYPLTLAALRGDRPDLVFSYRFPSLLATALSGVLVHAIARRALPRGAALAPQLLFYAAPAEFFGLLALPQALMQLCYLGGISLLFYFASRTTLFCGAALMVVSVLYKPLALSPCLAAGTTMLALPHLRWRAVQSVPIALLVGLLAWGLLHVTSDGVFTRMIQLQSSRYAYKGGFDKMMQYEGFRSMAQASGVATSLQWNVNEHRRAFGGSVLNGNAWLLAMGAAGFLLSWTARGRPWAATRLLLTAWVAATLTFLLFVWDPIMEHYFVAYVPPLAVFAGVLLHALWTAPRVRLGARAVALAGLVPAVLLGVLNLSFRWSEAMDVSHGTPFAGETWLTFDPLVNFLTKTAPGCGIIDPFNVYGENSLVSAAPEFARYYTTGKDVVRCLEEHPDTKVALGFWGKWFLDDELRAYIDRLPPERRRLAPPLMWPGKTRNRGPLLAGPPAGAGSAAVSAGSTTPPGGGAEAR